MFMITALQIQAYQATKDDPEYNTDPWWPSKANSQNRYLDRAVREMVLMSTNFPASRGSTGILLTPLSSGQEATAGWQ